MAMCTGYEGAVVPRYGDFPGLVQLVLQAADAAHYPLPCREEWPQVMHLTYIISFKCMVSSIFLKYFFYLSRNINTHSEFIITMLTPLPNYIRIMPLKDMFGPYVTLWVKEAQKKVDSSFFLFLSLPLFSIYLCVYRMLE